MSMCHHEIWKQKREDLLTQFQNIFSSQHEPAHYVRASGWRGDRRLVSLSWSSLLMYLNIQLWSYACSAFRCNAMHCPRCLVTKMAPWSLLTTSYCYLDSKLHVRADVPAYSSRDSMLVPRSVAMQCIVLRVWFRRRHREVYWRLHIVISIPSFRSVLMYLHIAVVIICLFRIPLQCNALSSMFGSEDDTVKSTDDFILLSRFQASGPCWCTCI